MSFNDIALDRALIERVLSSHPVPIADATAALTASTSAHERRDRVVECFRAIIRYASALALSVRVQYGPGPDAKVAAEPSVRDAGEVPGRDNNDNDNSDGARVAVDHPEVARLLRTLRGRGLTDGQWVGLCRGLLRPWARVPRSHPLPALVELFHGGKRGRFVRAVDGLLEMRKSETVAHGATGGAGAITDVLKRRIPQLAMLLEQFEPVWLGARLVVPVADTRAETDIDPGGDPERTVRASLFMVYTPGRDRWRRVELPAADRLAPGQPVLIDDAGRPLLALAPVALVRRPGPESAHELFLLDGCRRRRAAYVAFPSMAEHLDMDGWRELDRQLGSGRAAATDETLTGKRPYRGLASFASRHAELFFGRDRETEMLANRIRRSVMVTVTGPSGSGKTSLLRAGVLPALHGYRQLSMRPGHAPMQTLMRRLREDFASELGHALSESAVRGVEPTLASLCRAHGVRLLVCVDQCEELFTLCRNGDERAAFAQALAGMTAAGADGPIRVVLSIRGDFFARLATLPALAGVYSRHVEVVTTPDADALRDILIRPANAFGYSFEDPELIATMLAPLAGEPAPLTMLQFAADRMWELRDRQWQRLTWAAYEAIGGVEGALAAHADSVLDALTTGQREIARTLLLRLITAEGTRAVVDQKTLLDTALAGANGANVLARLVDARLVVARETSAESAGDPSGESDAGAGSDASVELIHEALLLRWDRLRAWIDDDREALRVRDRVAAAASQWVRERAASDYLLAEGKPLAEAEALLTERIDLLQPNEIEFIQVSRRRRQRRRMVARVIVAGVLIVAVAAAFAGVYAWAEGRRATRAAVERQNAIDRAVHARLLARESQESARVSAEEAAARANEAAVARARSDLDRDPTASLAWLRLLDADVATRRTPIFAEARVIAASAHQRGVALDVLGAHKGGITQLAFRADGQAFASGSQDGELAVWDLQSTARRTLPGHTDEILDLSFSPDGNYLASVGADARVRLARADGTSSIELGGHTDSVTSVAFAPAGDRLATGGRDRAVLLWDLDQLDEPLERFGDFSADITDLAFSHNGVLLAIADADGGIRTWNQALGETASLSGHERRVDAIAFAPDSRALASVARDRTVRYWRLHGPEAPTGAVLGSHKQPAHSVAFSADGTRVLSAGSEDSAYLWPVDGGPVVALRGHVGELTSARFARDGTWVASAGSDKSVRLWSITDRKEVHAARVLRGHGDTVTALRVSPDGQTVLSGARDGEVRIWRLPAPAQVLGEHRALVNAVAISQSGRRVAAGDGVGAIALWRARATAAGEPEFAHERDLLGHTDVIHHLAFAPGDEALVSASADGTARLWPLEGAQLEPSVLTEHEGTVWFADFSPTGDRLVTAGDDGTARVWNWRSGRALTLSGHGQAVVHALFSPDGQYVATASWDHSARVFDSANGRSVATLEGHTDVLTRVAWSPDGARVATASWDRSARVFAVAAALAESGGDVSAMELRGHTDELNDLTFTADGAYLATAGSDRTVRIWPMTGQVDPTSLRGHDEPVTAILFVPDSNRLVSASRDGALRLWDLRAGNRSRTLFGHTDEINEIAISRDGRTIASASDDRTIRLWRDDLPEGAAELLDWVATVSNARWDSGGHLRSPEVDAASE